MKRRFDLVIAVSVVYFLSASCNYYSKKTENIFYNKVYQINDSLDQLTNDWLSLLNKATQTKDFSNLNSQRLLLGQFISRNRAIVAEIEITKRLEPIRTDENAFLTGQAECVSEVYTYMEQFNEYTPQETMNKYIKKVADNITAEKSDHEKIKTELDQFAVNNIIKK